MRRLSIQPWVIQLRVNAFESKTLWANVSFSWVLVKRFTFPILNGDVMKMSLLSPQLSFLTQFTPLLHHELKIHTRRPRSPTLDRMTDALQTTENIDETWLFLLSLRRRKVDVLNLSENYLSSYSSAATKNILNQFDLSSSSVILTTAMMISHKKYQRFALLLLTSSEPQEKSKQKLI